jgi:hypothetical protein
MFKSNHPLFRSLNKVEIERFRDYARENEPPSLDSWTITHPICRAEWRKLGKVNAGFPMLSEEMDASRV